MAGLSIAPAAGNQFSAIVRLRWHLFVNSLRTSRGATELASRMFIGLLVAFGGLFGQLTFAVDLRHGALLTAILGFP